MLLLWVRQLALSLATSSSASRMELLFSFPWVKILVLEIQRHPFFLTEKILLHECSWTFSFIFSVRFVSSTFQYSFLHQAKERDIPDGRNRAYCQYQIKAISLLRQFFFSLRRSIFSSANVMFFIFFMSFALHIYAFLFLYFNLFDCFHVCVTVRSVWAWTLIPLCTIVYNQF